MKDTVIQMCYPWMPVGFLLEYQKCVCMSNEWPLGRPKTRWTGQVKENVWNGEGKEWTQIQSKWL